MREIREETGLRLAAADVRVKGVILSGAAAYDGRGGMLSLELTTAKI